MYADMYAYPFTRIHPSYIQHLAYLFQATYIYIYIHTAVYLSTSHIYFQPWHLIRTRLLRARLEALLEDPSVTV